MPADELSPDEFYALSEGAGGTQVAESTQQRRDAESLPILQQERKDPKNAKDEASLSREIHARRESANAPKEMSVDAFYKVGGTQPPDKVGGGRGSVNPPAADPAKREMPDSIFGKVKSISKQGAREVAEFGDMILSAPGGMIASIAGIGAQAQAEADDIGHREAGKKGKEIADIASDRLSTNVFSRYLAKGLDEGEQLTPTHVHRAMDWLNAQIDKGAEFIDKKTGGKLTKEEVQQEAQLALNALGAKGLMKVGGVLALAKKSGEAPKSLEAKEGLPHEPEEGAEEAKVSPAEPEKKAEAAGKRARAKKSAEGLNSPTPPKALYDRLYESLKAGTKPIIHDPGWESAKEAFRKGEIKDGEGLRDHLEDQHTSRQLEGAEAGGVSWDQMKTIAGLSLGFAAGAYLDPENPIVAGLTGMILGGGAAAGALRKGGEIAKSLRAPDMRTRINGMTEAHEYEYLSGVWRTWQSAKTVADILPKKADREEVLRAIDEGKTATLTGPKAEAAKQAERFWAETGEAAKTAGVIDSLREHYATHYWTDPAKARDILSPKSVGPNMSPDSPFNNPREFATLRQGKAAGLTPRTEDLAEVMSMYGDSISRTIANKHLIERLKGASTEGGDRLLRPAGKAPGNYVAINHPSLARYRVHPDIAPSLEFMYTAQDAHGIMAAVSMFNTALKRNAVSFSLFHAKALADAMMGTMNPLVAPFAVGKVVAQAALPKIFGANRYLRQVEKAGAGSLPDRALKAGLKFSLENKESVDSDVGQGFYKTLRDTQNILDDKVFKGAGMPIRAYVRINHAFDNFMWGRLHAAMKLEVFAAKSEALMKNTAKDKSPLSEADADRIAAGYSNYVFGGINWQRIAEGVNNKFGRDLALKAFSPSGRRGLQLAMFAPDWTISTSMAFAKAFEMKGTGVKGLVKPRTATDLYRQQLMRSAFWYVLIGDALNMHFANHHLWENKDPFYVELGDGRKAQISKHFTEPFHWFTKPGQQAVNKLGAIPSEFAEQVTGKEYLSTTGAPPMKDRVKHALKRLVPIGAGQFDNGVGPGVSGALGVPIYGKTAEQKSAAKKQAREEAFRKRMEQYKKHAGVQQ